MRGVNIADMVDRVTLPDGLQWLEISGIKVFPVYGVSGSLQAQCLSILLDSHRPPDLGFDMGFGLVDDERGHWFTIRFNVVEDHHSVTAKFKEAFDAMKG